MTPRDTKIIAFSNQKGGVGKSMLSTQFAYYLTAHRKKVLFVDGDYQGTSSGLLRHAGEEVGELTAPEPECTYTYELYTKELERIIPLQAPFGVDLIPSAINDLNLVDCSQMPIPETLRLRDNLAKITAEYDYVIFDCPPSLGPVMIGPILASRYVIAPLRLGGMLEQNLSGIMATIEECRQVNPDLELLGYVLNDLNRTKPEQEIFEELSKAIHPYMFPRPIMRRQAILTAAIRHLPIAQCSGGHKAQEELYDVFGEILKRMGQKPLKN